MKKIENASDYALTDEGHMVNLKTNTQLKRVWSHTRQDHWSNVVADDGRTVRVWHEEAIARPQMDSESLSDLLAIPTYPDYKIASHGAVWRVKGKKLRQPILMAQHERYGKPYVQLTLPDGRRHNKPVKMLLEMAQKHALDTAP